MTGFASVEGEVGDALVRLDARSVNSRGLDVRLRLPNGFDSQELEVRRAVQGAFQRGSVSITATVAARTEAAARYTVNAEQLAAYLDAIEPLAERGAVAAPRADGLLALKGVIETAGEGEAKSAEVGPLGPLVAALLDGLVAERRAEGTRIVPVLEGQLAEIERLGKAIDAHPERALDAVKVRLKDQIDTLLDRREGLSDDRLHQEAALLATRADVREELDRLTAHVAAARALIAEGGAIGRKLDFLAQEFNRETNTVCSKSPHHEITALGLELKSVVEQFREQVQNIQ
ncbi:MAG: YicC/YloC family endoribonuclease [Pseudomonadota bacterium]